MREQWHSVDHRNEDAQRNPREQTNPAILYRRVLLALQQLFSRVVRHYPAKTSNTFDRSMLAERFAFSVLMTLTSSAILLMSFTFAILAGSILILTCSITLLANCGRRTLMFVKNTTGE